MIVTSDPNAQRALEEIHRASDLLDEAGALPFSRIDEAEALGKEAIRILYANGADVAGLVTQRARWFERLRSFQRALDLWVLFSRACFVGVCLALCAGKLTGMGWVAMQDDPAVPLVILVITALWPAYCEVERWKYSRRPINNVFG